MRMLILLLAAILSLGAYFSDGKPAPGSGVVAGSQGCRDEACRAMRLADPRHAPHSVPE